MPLFHTLVDALMPVGTHICRLLGFRFVAFALYAQLADRQTNVRNLLVQPEQAISSTRLLIRASISCRRSRLECK